MSPRGAQLPKLAKLQSTYAAVVYIRFMGLAIVLALGVLLQMFFRVSLIPTNNDAYFFEVLTLPRRNTDCRVQPDTDTLKVNAAHC